MALFPQGVTQIDQRCNAGERRVLHQLKRCLGDDYLVWHDVPIGPKARQPDFVVLSPRWGILLLEVKDWKRSSLGPATRDAVELSTPRGRVTQAHPLRQARDHAMELVDLMRCDPALVHAEGPFAGRLLFPYGWGVALSTLRQGDVAGSDFNELFPPSRTLLRDDLDDGVAPAAFEHRLWGMFTVTYPHTLTLPQRDRIRWHLFPEVRLQTQASLELMPDETERPSLHLPDLMQVMDLQQEQIARSLGDGHRVIHGAAGSGKTMILVFRAQVLAAAARADRPILVMCFNRTLADRIDALLRNRGIDERVQVRTFHSWCQDMVKSYQLDVPRELKGDAYFERLAQVVERSVETGLVPAGQYSALLIDEAHDFEAAWLRIAGRMVSPATNSLLVLYDDAQSIYQRQRRRFSFASVGIDARGRTSILKLNYRNTAEVLALAVHCAQSLLQGAGDTRDDDDMALVQPASAGRRGALPVLIDARNEWEEAELIAERIVAAHDAGAALEDIAVLCRAKFLMRPIEQALARRQLAVQSMNGSAFRRFDWKRPSIKLLTMHSAKGLEFARVFVAGLQSLPMSGESQDEAFRLLYVAMTRATHELLLSAHGRSVVVERVRESLADVTRQFRMKRIYLAGPEVFFADADRHFEALEARCAAFGLLGVRPSDGGLSQGMTGSGEQIAARIYRANIALIAACDGLLANLMPFRNALEPDSGTVFELGMAVALGKPVAGIVPRRDMTYEAKVIAHCGVTRDAAGLAWDAAHGLMVEEFGQPMNLMLAQSTHLFDDAEAALRHLQRQLLPAA